MVLVVVAGMAAAATATAESMWKRSKMKQRSWTRFQAKITTETRERTDLVFIGTTDRTIQTLIHVELEGEPSQSNQKQIHCHAIIFWFIIGHTSRFFWTVVTVDRCNSYFSNIKRYHHGL
jgi:hypothetical protein